jgi:hypothetical protein
MGQGVHTTLRSHMNPYGGYEKYAGVWGDGHYAYIGSERMNGVLIYDISDPNAPVLASYYNPANSQDIEDIKVANGIGYFASNLGGGLHIVDVSNPANPQLLSTLTSANGGYDNTHKVGVWQNFVFIPQNLTPPALIKVFDVSNPAVPVLKSTFTATDPQWINDIDIQTNTAGTTWLFASGWGGKTDIWNITQIATSAPTLVGSFTSGVSSSSCSATSDFHYLACSRKTTDGKSEVKLYDISNPASVSVVSTISMPAFGISAVAPHDPKIVGNLLYASWYQAGVLIFDISNPAVPLLVGSYDTYPSNPAAGTLEGNWGVYPYLGQDRVLLSDRETGLYVIDATGVSSQPALYNLLVTPATVVGPASSTASAYLVGLAPAGGAVVTLTSNNVNAVVPASLTIPQGSHSGSATVTTSAVSSKVSATLKGTYSGASRTAVLTVTPDIPSSLKFAPLSLIGGSSTVGTVTLAAQATVDVPVSLTVTAGNAAVTSMPPSITVPAGSSSATFSLVTASVAASTAVKVSAAANGTTVVGSLTVTPNGPTTVTFTPATVKGGGSATGKVTFGLAVAADTTVTLTVASGGSAINSIPATVMVPQGATSATWTVVTQSVISTTAASIKATANGVTKAGTLTVVPNSPSAVSFTPATVKAGASSTGKVTFTVPVVANTVITLTVGSGAPAIASIPASVTVLQGTTSATFPVTTTTVTSSTPVSITATANGGSKAGTLTVAPNTPASVLFSPSTVTGGATSTGKVTFSPAVPSDTTVTLTVVTGGPAVFSMPASMVVPAGSTTGTFQVVTAPVPSTTSVQISATAFGSGKTGTLTVN